MKERLQNHILIASILLFVALAFVLGTWFVHFNQRELESAIRSQIGEERTTLMTLADITDRNGADDIIAATIADCSRRDEYESLLVKLSVLSKKELLTLQNLFEGCGSFYAERKALMVGKMERELQNYDDLITLLGTLSQHDLTSYNLDVWRELVTLERTRSTLLSDQKDIQADIISALILGESVSGERVSSLVVEAQEINQLLTVHDRQIDEKREKLRE